MWLICIRRLNELRAILYGPKKKVNSFGSALCLQKKCDLVKFINDVMITWIPHKNDAKSKTFCPTRRTHTHTARRVKSQKMDYMPEKRETQSEQRCADKPSHAKPSQTQQI